MKTEPVAYVWDGRAMVPLDRFMPLARRQFRAGQEYALVEHRGRSDESHRHYFACVKKGWENLPEAVAPRFPTPEYLRKWCLVQEGYAEHVEHVFVDHDEMAKMVLLVRKLDPYAVMKSNDLVLNIWFALSQDHASMNHEAFQKSKDDVMGRIAQMCGITVKELAKNAKENA